MLVKSISLDDYQIVLIPKNASTWLVKSFYMHKTQVFAKDSRTSVCILRDPIDRWASGVAQFLATKHAKKNLLNLGVYVRCYVDNMQPLDPHSVPQVDFVNDIDMNNTIWFNLDKNFETNFDSWVEENKIQRRKLPIINKIEKKDKRVFHKNFFSNYYKNHPKDQKGISNFYRKDFELVRSVQFYEAR